MSGMSRERFEELKEAYALGAVSEEERLEIEQYLAESPSERADVDELSSIASLLALAPPEQEPSSGLRQSLMSQVRSEAGASEETASETDHTPRSGWVQRLFGARGVVTAAAAAVFIGLAVWNVSLQSEVQDLRSSQQMSAYELQGSGKAKSVRGELVRIGDQRAMLVATDLPELPKGKTYEIWSIDKGQPHSAGVFKPGEGPTIKPIDQTVPDAEKFAITIEPEGGSEQPTTKPIVEADLTQST